MIRKWLSFALALCMLCNCLPSLAQDDAFFSLFDSIPIPEEAHSIDSDEDDDGSKSISLNFHGNGAAITDDPDYDYLKLYHLEMYAYTGSQSIWIGMDEEVCLFSKSIPLNNGYYLTCWLNNNTQSMPSAHFTLVQEPRYNSPFGVFAIVSFSKEAILPYIESRDLQICENILDVTLESLLLPCFEACAQYAGITLDANPAAIERKSYAGPDLSGPLHQYFDVIQLPKGFTRNEYAAPYIRTDERSDNNWIYDLSATIGKGDSAFKIKSDNCDLDITTWGYGDRDYGDVLSRHTLMSDQGFELECILFIEEYPDPLYPGFPDTIAQEYGEYHDGNLANCHVEFRWKHRDTYFARLSTRVSGIDSVYPLSSMQVRMHAAQIMDFMIDELALPVLNAVSAAYEDPVDTGSLQAQPYSAGTAFASLSLPGETAIAESGDSLLFASGADYSICFLTLKYESQSDYDWVDSFSDQTFAFDNYHLLASNLTEAIVESGTWYKALKLTDIGMLNGQKVVCGAGKYGSTSYAACAQHYRDIGYIVMAYSDTLSSQKLLDVVDKAMLSVRLEGVSEEDMANDAAACAEPHASDVLGHVVAQKGCNIRSGPGTDFDKIGSAAPGDRFPLLGEEGNWYLIELNGQTGYISKGQCEQE